MEKYCNKTNEFILVRVARKKEENCDCHIFPTNVQQLVIKLCELTQKRVCLIMSIIPQKIWRDAPFEIIYTNTYLHANFSSKYHIHPISSST